VVAAIATISIFWHQTQDRPARAVGSTPDLAMSIDVNGGGDDCDTRPSTGSIGTTCAVAVGAMFTVKGHVDSFTGISGTGGYGGIGFQFNHSAGLTLLQRSMVTELGPGGSPFWPDCGSRSETKPSGGYRAECHAGIGNSMFLGKVVEQDYECATAGSRTVTLDDAGTVLYNSGHVADNSDKEGDEVLTISCVVVSVGGVAELPDLTGDSLEERGGGAANAGLVAGAAAAALAGALALGGVAWQARRRRRR
jgi:hypothetical protein